MSGSEAMHRIYTAADRHTLDDPQIVALADLAARVRSLTDAVVHTAVPAEEIAAVAAEVAELTARLSAARGQSPPISRIEGPGRALASPVSGPLNPIAPPVEIEALPGGGARATYTLGAVYEGPPTFVHGGVSALILDQVLGVAAAANGTPGMTATLDLRYRRPTPYGVPLTAEARVSRTEGRKTWVDATITAPDGRTTVEATAMFILPLRLADG